jgi:hypothetical protein
VNIGLYRLLKPVSPDFRSKKKQMKIQGQKKYFFSYLIHVDIYQINNQANNSGKQFFIVVPERNIFSFEKQLKLINIFWNSINARAISTKTLK